MVMLRQVNVKMSTIKFRAFSTILMMMFCIVSFAQKKKDYYTLDVHGFYGTILNHNPEITHLITGHPSGGILSLNRKTFGEARWQRLYNYPDYGLSLIYQNLDNPFLGQNTGLYLHYNFYFIKRILMFRLGQGIAYTTKPYDQDTNFRNNAYGSKFLSSTFFLLNLKKENIFRNFGMHLGLGVVHYSNANFKAPNKSTNTLLFDVGITYEFERNIPSFVPKKAFEGRGKEPLGFGLILRSGINESDLVGSGQYPFYTITAFADKRLSKLSALQLGAELFFSEALERFIEFRGVGGFNDGVTGDEDAKRVGVFVGHELRIHNVSMLTQLGCYAYYPFDFEGQIYNRIGLQYYISKHVLTSITVRSHAAKAEVVEFSIGYRL